MDQELVLNKCIVLLVEILIYGDYIMGLFIVGHIWLCSFKEK